jgi:hypothetical protein
MTAGTVTTWSMAGDPHPSRSGTESPGPDNIASSSAKNGVYDGSGTGGSTDPEPVGYTDQGPVGVDSALRGMGGDYTRPKAISSLCARRFRTGIVA